MSRAHLFPQMAIELRKALAEDKLPEFLDEVLAAVEVEKERQWREVVDAHAGADASRAQYEQHSYLMFASNDVEYAAKSLRKWRIYRDRTDEERREASKQEEIARLERDLEFAKRMPR